MIPRQTDVSGLLRMVKYCSLPLMAFQCLCLCIETPLRERDRLYCLDVTTNSASCSRLEMNDDEDRYSFFRQVDPRILTRKDLQRDFPAVAQLAVLQEFGQYLLLPLAVAVNGYRAVLLFIWTGEDPLKQDLLAFCTTLGLIVSSSLSQRLLSEEQNMEIEALRNERDHLNILVSVANVAASTLDLEKLVTMVSMDLRRFFSVNDVAFELYEENDQISVHAVDLESQKAISLPCQEALLANLRFAKPFCLLREKALREQACDPLVRSLLDNGDTAACAFSLTFQQKNLGALIFGYSQAEIFTRDTVSLLVQIARTLAQSLYNAREYASMATSRKRLARENADLERTIDHQRRRQGPLIGQSPAMRKVLEQIEMVASSDSTVLILGETGTGKEVVAEAIHRASSRKAKPMVKINCAAMPAALLENELFGHEKGAFTGALSQSKGRFEQAKDSTLLLDEIGDLPLDLQPKLLRILQSRELERLGGHTVIPVNVRVVAASHQNLQQMVEAKRFREDLYYRLNVFPIHLPPLRERREDIPLLAQHFMAVFCQRMHKHITRISAEGLRWLCSRDWPGNVRELANVIERAVIVSCGKLLHLEMDSSASGQAHLSEAKAEAGGREAIIDAIVACNGLIAGPRGAAAFLGLKRTTLNSRMKRLGLDVKSILAQAR
ncbi:MAG: sigma 54-interacting transcriptional regulator [Desulfovibrio sp.]|nr:sigma 54-interacting transcriptional regulator [Desulfovibrio sp.]